MKAAAIVGTVIHVCITLMLIAGLGRQDDRTTKLGDVVKANMERNQHVADYLSQIDTWREDTKGFVGDQTAFDNLITRRSSQHDDRLDELDRIVREHQTSLEHAVTFANSTNQSIAAITVRLESAECAVRFNRTLVDKQKTDLAETVRYVRAYVSPIGKGSEKCAVMTAN